MTKATRHNRAFTPRERGDGPKPVVAYSSDNVNVANEPNNEPEKRKLPVLLLAQFSYILERVDGKPVPPRFSRRPDDADAPERKRFVRCVYVQTATAGQGMDADKALRAADGVKYARGVVVHRVPYNFRGHAYEMSDGTWKFESHSHEARCLVSTPSLRVYRADGPLGTDAPRAVVDAVCGILEPIVRTYAASPEAQEAFRLAEAAYWASEASSAEATVAELTTKMHDAKLSLRMATRNFDRVGGLPPEDVPCEACDASGFAGGRPVSEAWDALWDAEIPGIPFRGLTPEEKTERDAAIDALVASFRPPFCTACGGTAIDAERTASARRDYFENLPNHTNGLKSRTRA